MSLNLLLQQGVTVLTASRRLAHAVRLSFANEARKAGESVWLTPKALPWDSWLRQQYIASRSARARILRPAQARVLWDEIVSTSPAASDLLNPSSAARLAARSWRRLHDYLIPVEALLPSEAPEAQALLSWCREYQRRCQKLETLDDSRLSQWAFDSGFVPTEKIAIAGFDSTTPAMSRLLDRWHAAGQLVDAGIQAADSGAAKLLGAADAATEIELTAQWARDQVRAGATNVGVIVPDLQQRRDEIQRVFEDVLAPGARHTQAAAISLPVVIAAPGPLAGYPLVDAALLILRIALGDVSSAQAGRILRSPFLRGGESERAARAHADFRLREDQRDRWDWFKLERWAAQTHCDQLNLAARDLNVLLREGPSTATPSEWAERFHRLWLTLGWPGERTLSSVEYQTLEKFQEVLADFGALDLVMGRIGLGRALSRLQDLVNDTPFEPETTAAAITVIDAATSAGMKFDALWVCGLDADRWPAPVSPDPLIPLELQRAARVPEASAADVLDHARVQLRRWLTCSPVVVLSWPERDGDIELNRSPLLAGLEESEAGPVNAVGASLRRQLFENRPVLESLRDDRAPALPPQAARGGARTLELQSRCPFRAQGEVRLRAPQFPRISLGIQPVDRGAILHSVLADVWGALRSRDQLLAIDDAELARRIRDSAQRHTMEAVAPDTPSRTRLAMLEIESVTQLVGRLMVQERLRPPFTVELAETSEQYEIGGLSITLRPDRIDVLEGGGQLLIDYKLGDSHQPRKWLDAVPGRPPRPQLPLYGLAHAERLSALAYAVLAPASVEYRGWSNGTPVGSGIVPYPMGLRIDLGDPADWDALMHHWRFTLTRLAERYVAGDAVVDPLPQECATCHLSTLCRIHEAPAAEGEEGVTDDE
ncbi:hypothetical protein [Povalibacter uvarum]|uniref:hypothetical protein n=1 Tax=Povalibacter uvarum TaxID=732238 RepID=UPI00248353DD|nr:hypothetical protein [Povalibacter uvarum]